MGKDQPPKGWIPAIIATAGDSIICIIKLIGFLMSGSASLFSETIHSIADVSNQVLLIIGVKRSEKEASKTFVYGHKRERFLRGMIAACGIFFVGASVTIYKGINNLILQNNIEISVWTFIILAASCIMSIITLIVSTREIKKNTKHEKRKDIIEYADPITLAVAYQDIIAVIGIVVASIGLTMSYVTKDSTRDSIASIIIGLLLAYIAIMLIRKNSKFLIGQTIPTEIKEGIIKILLQDEIIDKVLDFKSLMLDMDTYQIKCEIECNGTGLLKVINRNNFLKNEYEEVKENYSDFLEFCIDYTRRVPRVIGTKIDAIEKKIKEDFPQVRHIDIEIN